MTDELKTEKTRRRLILRLSAFALTVVIFGGSMLQAAKNSRSKAVDSSIVSTLTTEGRLAVFDDVWETILERYYDPTFHGVDWQSERTTFRPAAAKATSTQEFYQVLRHMVGVLKDAHTRVYSPDDKFDWWSPRFVTAGVTVREVEGVPVVVQVEANSAAARTGIRPGDLIVKVNNLTSEELIRRRLQNSDSPSDAKARSRSIATLLEGAAGTPLELEWQGQNGKTKSGIFQRYWSQRQLGYRSANKGKVSVIS